MRSCFSPRCLSLVVSLLCSVGLSHAENILVVKKGDAFPAAGVDAVFDDFTPMALGTGGAVLFHASLTGTSVDGADEVIVIFQSGSYQIVAQKGQAAPGFGAGEVISELSEYGNLRGNNLMVFAGEISGTTVATGTNSQVVWTGTVGGISVLARQGTFVSGTAGDVYSETDFVTNSPFENLALSNSGSVIFYTALKASGTTPPAAQQDDALLLRSGTATTVILQEFYSSLGGGDIVSGTSASNLLFSSLGFTGTAYSFITQTSPVAPFSTNESTYLISSTGGFFSVIANTGDGSSKTGDGSIIRTVKGGAGNARGDFFFTANMGTSNGDSALKEKALWYFKTGAGQQLLARRGDAVAGLAAGVNYKDFGDPLVGEATTIAVYAELSGTAVTGTNDAALICGSTGGVYSILRTGDAWPANGVQTVDQIEEIYASGTRRVVVGAQSNTGALAVLKVEGGGTISNLHTEGDALTTDQGSLGNSVELYFSESSSSQSGQRAFFNDNGQLAIGVKTNTTEKALVLLDVPASAVPAPQSEIQVKTGGAFSSGTGNQNIKRGKTKSSTLRITNGGATAGRFVLKGPTKSNGVKFRYFDGAVEITTAVTAGQYIVETLAPAASKDIRVDSKVGGGARPNLLVTVKFVSTAMLDGSVSSTQKLRINIK